MMNKYSVYMGENIHNDLDYIFKKMNLSFHDSELNDSLEEKLSYLSLLPNMYQIKMYNFKHEIRVAKFTNYLLCYETMQSTHKVLIYNVFYKTENYLQKKIHMVE